MIAALTILREAKSHGLNIHTIDGNLHVQPRDRITDSIRATIRQHKDALVDFLETWEERAAIMEYDAGMSRTQAETAAFEDLTKGNRND